MLLTSLLRGRYNLSASASAPVCPRLGSYLLVGYGFLIAPTKDRLQHLLGGMDHLLVFESENSQPFRSHAAVTNEIFVFLLRFIVDRTVYFNHKTVGRTVEISDVTQNKGLPAKSDALSAKFAEVVP